MDDGDRGRWGDLTELRFRLYRRDPPDGAVEAYLAALAHASVLVHAAPARPTVRPGRRHRPRRPVPVRALLRGVAMVAATAAFAALLPVAMRQLGTMTGITGATPIAVETMTVPPATGTALGTMAGGGASTARFAAGGNSVTVSVLCSGRGTMTLRVAADQPTVLPCDTAQPAFAMLQSTGRLDRFTVVVRADPAVRWTLSVGALRPPTPTPHVVRSSA